MFLLAPQRKHGVHDAIYRWGHLLETDHIHGTDAVEDLLPKIGKAVTEKFMNEIALNQWCVVV